MYHTTRQMTVKVTPLLVKICFTSNTKMNSHQLQCVCIQSLINTDYRTVENDCLFVHIIVKHPTSNTRDV